MPGLVVAATVSCMVAPGRVDDLVVALLYLDGDAELEVVHDGLVRCGGAGVTGVTLSS